MRITFISGLLASCVALACSCSTTRPATADEQVSIPVSCTGGQSVVDCLKTAADLCGEKGYDLFDKSGQPIAAADIRNRFATARCRR